MGKERWDRAPETPPAEAPRLCARSLGLEEEGCRAVLRAALHSRAGPDPFGAVGCFTLRWGKTAGSRPSVHQSPLPNEGRSGWGHPCCCSPIIAPLIRGSSRFCFVLC